MPSSRDSRPTPNRIREVRKQRGMTMQELGEKAGMHYTTVAKIERSQRGLKLNYLAAIAAALGVKPIDLIGGAPDVMPIRMVPLVGKIAAGNWSEAIEDPIGTVPAPVGGPNAFALRPDGDSMDLIVGPDSYIVVDPDEFELRDGKVYAMKNGDGETTFKRFRAEPPRLEPCSSNPEHKPIPFGREPLTTIGRVVWQGSEL